MRIKVRIWPLRKHIFHCCCHFIFNADTSRGQIWSTAYCTDRHGYLQYNFDVDAFLNITLAHLCPHIHPRPLHAYERLRRLHIRHGVHSWALDLLRNCSLNGQWRSRHGYVFSLVHVCQQIMENTVHYGDCAHVRNAYFSLDYAWEPEVSLD